MNIRQHFENALAALAAIVGVVLVWAIFIGYPLCPQGKTFTQISGQKLSFACR